MSQKRKVLWFKLKLLFSKQGRHGDSFTTKSNLNEEYKEAFRTKSYIDIYTKVQSQLEMRTTRLDEAELATASPAPPSSPPTQYVHLSEILLEPHQEALSSLLQTSNNLQFLVSYFDVSLNACRICESLLANVHQLRCNYRAIKTIIKLTKRFPNSANWSHDEYRAVYRNLASFSLQRNPFSAMKPEKFHELHDSHEVLLRELTSQCRKTKRRTDFIRLVKRATAGFLILRGCGALAVVALVQAIQAMVAAPGLVVCCLGLFMMKKLRWAEGKCSERRLRGLTAQLDIAARGVYIMINDFDTVSRLVRRLHDETEHRKFVADICVRKGKNEILKEVVREFQMDESCFLDQLEELEKQIYLCFLDINRSRRLLVREMVKC